MPDDLFSNVRFSVLLKGVQLLRACDVYGALPEFAWEYFAWEGLRGSVCACVVWGVWWGCLRSVFNLKVYCFSYLKAEALPSSLTFPIHLVIEYLSALLQFSGFH